MAYAVFSVVYGEQPSAAKWNILGSNDASFNDGTGIANIATNVTAIYNPYKFSAYRNAALTPNTADVIFDTELFDTNNDFSTSTGKYTVPVSGFYQLNACLVFITAAGNLGYGCGIKKNSTVQTQSINVMMYDNAYIHGFSVSLLIQATTGDTFSVVDTGGCNRPLQVGIGGNGFSGFLVSRT